MSKQLLVLYDLKSDDLEELKELATDYEVIDSVEKADPEATEIIVGWSPDAKALVEDENSRVKWVQFPFAGVNNLPLDLFEEKDIILTSGSGIHTYAVSETAMGLLLGMTRNIITSALNKQKEEWIITDQLYELHGKTMMIVGAGKIGIHLGQIAQGFSMKTIGINRSGRDIKNMDEQYVQDDLPEVLNKADIVVNILPSTKETVNLYDADLFAKMKDGAIFINVGRGESVDTDALIEALDSGKLLFAGLDVFEEEPLPEGHPVWTHEKIAMTPHTAGQVEDYPGALYEILLENFRAFVQNEELPRNVVAYETGY